MAHGFVYALLVVRAVILNGNYTRHFRRNWDVFRRLRTLATLGIATYGAGDTTYSADPRFQDVVALV